MIRKALAELKLWGLQRDFSLTESVSQVKAGGGRGGWRAEGLQGRGGGLQPGGVGVRLQPGGPGVGLQPGGGGEWGGGL